MQLDIIAFGAHPDDVELFAGGTLAKMASQGYRTGIVDMSRGELGTRGTPEERAREAKEAATVLRLAVRENLRLPDGEISVDSKARLRVIKVLRKYRPSLILLHHWEDKHPDHVNTSILVSQAAHHSGLARIKTGQERFRPNRILYFKLPPQWTPSFIVDVSEFATQRRTAIEAYRSQLFDPASREPVTELSRPGFLLDIENIHRYYGTLIGRAEGEGFYTRGPLEVADPVDFFAKQASRSFF
jgi:bacillithiol biosynthesis deacetylase BshB1